MIHGRLKDFRYHLGLNQTEMADALGVTQSQYSKLEKGVNDLSTAHLAKLTGEYDLSLGWLITGKGPMLATEDEAIWSDVFIPVSLPHGATVDQGKTETLVKSVMEYGRLPLGPNDFAYNLLWAIAERSIYDNPKLNLQGETIPVITSALNTIVDLLQVALKGILTNEKSVTIRVRGKAFVFSAP